MKISEIVIHNVRTIKDARLKLKNYSLLVGPNNAGKSNIIDAIRLFYEHDKLTFADKDKCWFANPGDTEVWIEIEYILTDAEYSDLKEDYRLPENKLKVRKYFRTHEVGDDGKMKSGYYAYAADGHIYDSRFYGEKNVASGKLGKVIYIPAMSNVEETTKLTGPSPLRTLITNVLERVIEGNAAYEKLQKDLSEFSKNIKDAQTEDEKSLAQLQADISKALQGWNSKFELDFKPLDSASIVKSLIAYKIGEAVDNMNPDQLGSGFQRHLIYSLLDIAARYPTPKTPKKTKEFCPNLSLLLFEEPEAFLHPDQQLAMCRNLKRLALDDTNQVLISTHSPHFISQNIDDIPSIIKLNKPDKITQTGQISDNKLKEILEENIIFPDEVNDDRSDIDKTTDMEALKYMLWLDPQRCGCFFSKLVLLVEGPTEKALFNYLFDKELIKLPRGGVFILDTLGKWNMAKFMRILGELKISHSVIFDDDNQSQKQKPWNDHIIKSKNEFTRKITPLKGDLETLLGTEKPKKHPERKPQYLLYKWIKDEIEPQNKEKILSLLHSCITLDE